MLKLRNIILRVSAVLLQQGEHVVVFVARVGLVESLQVAVDSPPGPLLLVRVLNQGNLLSTMIDMFVIIKFCYLSVRAMLAFKPS